VLRRSVETAGTKPTIASVAPMVAVGLQLKRTSAG
jgi:hypothetical protein